MRRRIVDRLLEAEGDILIACHRTPDGDTVGAGLAVFLWLGEKGKKARVYCADPVPGLYRFLPGAGGVSSDFGQPPEVLVAVDCASIDRIGGDAGGMLKKVGAVINIDHHASNPMYGDLNLVVGNAGSTSELIVEILLESNQSVTREMADCLYTGIVTDTGQFSFDYTRPESLRMAALLMERGADFEGICARVFRKRTLARTKLIASALSSLRLYAGERIAVISIAQSVLKETGSTPDECENIVNYAVELECAEIGILLRETPDRDWKASLRASGAVDVSNIAMGFGGGGHAKAAGCTLPGPLADAEKKIVDASAAALPGL